MFKLVGDGEDDVEEKNGICDALRDLIPFVQFEKREKHPWRSVYFSKVAGFSQIFRSWFLNIIISEI